MKFHECERCGGAPEVVHFRDQVDFKGLTLDVDGLVKSVCTKCRHVWVTPGQHQDNLTRTKAAYAVRRDELRAELGLLSGEEIGRVLKLLSLTKAQAAELFGGGPNAFGKYLSGDVLQSFAMDRLMRLTVAGGDAALAVLKSGAARQLELNSMFRTPSIAITIDPSAWGADAQASRPVVIGVIANNSISAASVNYAG